MIAATTRAQQLSGGVADLHQSITGSVVGIVISFGAGREGAVSRPKINQRLHGLQLLRLKHVQSTGRQDEMRETAVELLLKVKVIEWVDEMSPVEVGVDPEHLSEYSLADLQEVFRKSTSTTNPVSLARVGKLRQRSGGDGRVVRERDSVRIRREDVGVVNLSRDPALHERDILLCRKLNRLSRAIQPGEGVIAGTVSIELDMSGGEFHLRASRHARAGVCVANSATVLLLLVDHTYKVPQVAIVLDN